MFLGDISFLRENERKNDIHISKNWGELYNLASSWKFKKNILTVLRQSNLFLFKLVLKNKNKRSYLTVEIFPPHRIILLEYKDLSIWFLRYGKYGEDIFHEMGYNYMWFLRGAEKIACLVNIHSSHDQCCSLWKIGWYLAHLFWCSFPIILSHSCVPLPFG